MPDLAERRRREAADGRHFTIDHDQVSLCRHQPRSRRAGPGRCPRPRRRHRDHRRPARRPRAPPSRSTYAVRWPPVSSPAASSPSTSTTDTGTGDGEVDGTRKTRRPSRRVVLHVHLSRAALEGTDHVGRVENTRTPVTADQIRDWCGHPDTHLTVKPVIDLDDHVARRPVRDPRPHQGARRAPRPHLRLPLVHPPRPETASPTAIPATATTSPPGATRVTAARPAPAPSRRCADPPPTQDPHRLDLHDPRPRHLPLVQPPRLPVPPRPPRHPRRHLTDRPAPTTMTPPHTPPPGGVTGMPVVR